MYKVLSIFGLFLAVMVFGEENPSGGAIVSERYIGAVGVMEYVMSNGMKVAVKSTLSQSDDAPVLVSLFAKGGWIVCTERDRASAKYAGTIALESGFPDMPPSDLARYVAEHNIDLSVRTRQCLRTVEGSCGRNELAALFSLVYRLMATPAFTHEGFEKVLQNSKDAGQYRAYDCEALYEDLFYALNTNGSDAYKYRLDKELAHVDFERAHRLFVESFMVPGDFTCVVVGPVTFEEVKAIAMKYLATIPAQPSSDLWRCPPPTLPFPDTIQKKTIACGDDEESLVRITFSMVQPYTPAAMQNLDYLSQVIEIRLRHVFLENMQSTYGVDVSYIFPLHPYTVPAYLVVQYRCPEKLDSKLLQRTLLEISDLQQRGPSLEEIHTVQVLLRRMNRYWSQDESYWLAAIGNYYKWGWDPSLIVDETRTYEENTPVTTKTALEALFSTDAYTVATMVRRR